MDSTSSTRPRRLRTGLRLKVIITLLVASTPGLVLLWVYAASVIEDAEVDRLLEQIAERQETAGQRIEEVLSVAANDALFLARGDVLSGLGAALATGDEPSVAELRRRAEGELRTITEVRGIYGTARFIALSGRELVRVTYVRRENRIEVASEGDLADLSDDPVWQATSGLACGRLHVSRITPDAEHTPSGALRALIHYSVPVGEPGEPSLGVLDLGVLVQPLLREVAALEAWLVDERGDFIYRPVEGRGWESQGVPGEQGSIRDEVETGALMQLASMGTAVSGGRTLVGAHVYVAGLEAPWMLVGALPGPEIQALISLRLAQSRYWLAIVAIAGLMGPLLAGVVLASFFLRALPRLRKATQAVARGDLTARVRVDSGDEMEDLAREFNHMAARLEELGRLEHAIALEKLKDDLIHMIVHDLRTPLTSLLGSLQTMQMMQDDTAIRKELLPLAISSGNTLLNMINDLLDINKMESGILSLSTDTVSVGGVCDEAVSSVKALAGDKGLELTCDVPADLPALLGDKEKIRRILVNLLGNAIKFTPKGGSVIVSAHAETEIEGVHIVVRDTGEGIPEEYRERIFEKFGQVESRRARKMVSTGLGLTFCKMAAEAHGGRIWVESEVGVGSTFHVQLPLNLACPLPPL